MPYLIPPLTSCRSGIIDIKWQRLSFRNIVMAYSLLKMLEKGVLDRDFNVNHIFP